VGYFAQKIPNFFQGTFVGNHRKIRKNTPKNISNYPQKHANFDVFSATSFCASLNPQLTQLTTFELTAAMAFDFVL